MEHDENQAIDEREENILTASIKAIDFRILLHGIFLALCDYFEPQLLEVANVQNV